MKDTVLQKGRREGITTRSLDNLQAANLTLHTALQQIYDAVMNHKLNTVRPSATDTTLWSTVEEIVEFVDE